MNRTPAIELAVTRAARWSVAAITVGAVAGWVVSVSFDTGSLTVVIAHLTLLATLGVAVAWDLLSSLDGAWFLWVFDGRGSEKAKAFARTAASAGSVVALATGVVALASLATAATLRFAPSLQYLQLLSALDIAWAAAATLIGATWLWGRGIGLTMAAAVVVVCVWAIWNYLRIVGLGVDGGWIVDGGALLRHVLVYDMAAALLAVTILAFGVRSRIRLPATAV